MSAPGGGAAQAGEVSPSVDGGGEAALPVMTKCPLTTTSPVRAPDKKIALQLVVGVYSGDDELGGGRGSQSGADVFVGGRGPPVGAPVSVGAPFSSLKMNVLVGGHTSSLGDLADGSSPFQPCSGGGGKSYAVAKYGMMYHADLVEVVERRYLRVFMDQSLYKETVQPISEGVPGTNMKAVTSPRSLCCVLPWVNKPEGRSAY